MGVLGAEDLRAWREGRVEDLGRVERVEGAMMVKDLIGAAGGFGG